MKKDLRFEKVYIYEDGVYKVGNDLAIVNAEGGFPFLAEIEMYSSLGQDIVVTFLGESGFNETKTLPARGEITIPRDFNGYTIFSLPTSVNNMLVRLGSSAGLPAKEVKPSMQTTEGNLYFAKVDALYYIEVTIEDSTNPSA